MRQTKAEAPLRRRRFTEEFKQDAVRLVVNEGYTSAAAAQAVGVGEQSVRKWHARLAPKPASRPDARHRIEHCTLVNPELLKRIAALGAIPMPFYTYVYYHGDKWAHYGEQRVRWMFAHRSFLDHGIRVAGASDYVPGPFEPLMAIQSMVTRTDYQGRVWGENQRISVAEALRICTIHGAHASFEERVKGSLTPGKLADFVMLADDPHRVESSRIKDIRVVRTVVGGQTVYPLSE